MKNLFHVRVLRFAVLREIEGARTAADHAALLAAMEFGDTASMSDAELREMCVMALQDLEPEDAAALVLRHDLGDRLKEGQIRNIACDMLEEKLWEHYADMSLHERLFNIGSLLYEAFPASFPEPDAVRVQLEVRAGNEAAMAVLARPLGEPWIVRLLADGMDDRSILHRLFGEQLSAATFPEADRIVWIVQSHSVDASTVAIDVTSSGYWLDSLRETKSYDSSARSDGP